MYSYCKKPQYQLYKLHFVGFNLKIGSNVIYKTKIERPQMYEREPLVS